MTDANISHRKKAEPCPTITQVCGSLSGLRALHGPSTLSVMKEYERLEAEEVTSCIACGSCQFTCPSHRPILDNIIGGKAAVMGIIRARNTKK